MPYKTNIYTNFGALWFYLFSAVIVYGFTTAYIIGSQSNIFLKFIFSTFFYLFFLLTMVSHSFAMIIDNSSEKNQINENPWWATFCGKCQKSRPNRSHHCRACNTCVIKMDHHCPWISNCVGEYNQKQFYLMLFYSGLSLGIVSLGTWNDFISMWTNGQPIISFEYENLPFINRLIVSFNKNIGSVMFFLSGILVIAVVVWLVVQYENIKYNMTTLEFTIYKGNYKECPYYKEDFVGNFKRIFGKSVVEWANPFFDERNESEDNGYVQIK